MKECLVNITKKHTMSVRRGLLAFAAFALIGFGIASCGETPDGGDSDGNETYTVTIKDGGTGFSASPAVAKKGMKVTLKAGEKEGYGFNGWNVVKPAGLTIAADNTFTMPEGAVEVTATWELGAYNITVNSDGATDSGADKNSAKEDETVTLNHGTKEGYTFIEWTDITPQGLVITPTAENDGAYTFTMPAEKVEVTAKWKAIDYDITVNQDEGDGGGSGSKASKNKANIRDTITLEVGTYKAGYEFDTWTVVKPESGLTIGEDHTFTMPASDVEVTATSKAINYSIEVNQGGGSDSATSKATANVGNIITLTPGNRYDYDFIGWAVVPANVSIAADHTFTMPASNVVVTAQWEEKPGVKMTSNHILTAQGLELTFTARVAPQSAPQNVTWSVAGNNRVSFVGNVLKVAADA
ncbi:MAG: InlB B-repeat-containing protein, partial [Treponema sp.]|nr:InlB B-repeat-containing protein [Treponema sp.]